MNLELFDTVITLGIFALIGFNTWCGQSNYREIEKLKEEIKEMRK